MQHEIIRREWFDPYLTGVPKFHLTMWNTGRDDGTGRLVLGYRLTIGEPGNMRKLFEGEDFFCSPVLSNPASDETLLSLLGFLCMEPGDTDQEFFENYTPDQMKFATENAWALMLEAEQKFGEGKEAE